jgi:hypothetical protein
MLSDTGESRVNGYLFVLERSLRTFLPQEVVRDAVREIESHVRERVAAADGMPDERRTLEVSSRSSARRCECGASERQWRRCGRS